MAVFKIVLYATAVTRGGTDTKRESTQKRYSGKEDSPATPAKTGTGNILIMSLMLYQQAILAPINTLWLE